MKPRNSEELERIEESYLAPYAMKSSKTRGRKYDEEKSPLRTEFQRDRDRIVHCSAFRRLEYKTQVFVYHEGDHYRTRLTHTLEVAQIARSIGKVLGLNENLIEAIVLSHDLGHTPFGHSGEDKMRELTKTYGDFNFEHNEQSLRVVDLLESRYPNFKGLNLTYEVREGIIKHFTEYDKPNIPDEFNKGEMPTLEAQIVNFADEIAYNNHDLDDGLTSLMLDEEKVRSIELWNEAYKLIKNKFSDKTFDELKRTTISGIITKQIGDLVDQTIKNLEKNKIESSKDIRLSSSKLVNFSPEMNSKNKKLKKFLLENLYKHSRVLRMEEKAKRVIKDLFITYHDCIEQIPPEFRKKMQEEKQRARIICDYIAGMTDRFAIEEHRKLFDPNEKV